MATVNSFTAEQLGDDVVLDISLTEGENTWTGRKVVAVGSDLKVEGDALAAEIIEANTPVAPEVPPTPVPLDVSGIVLEVA